MTMKIAGLALGVCVLSGCVAPYFGPDRAMQASDWPARYTRDGATTDDLNREGVACYHDRRTTHQRWATPERALLTVFVTGPLVGGDTSMGEDEHADCMRAKGWTVR